MSKILFVTNDAWFFVSHRLPIAKLYKANGGECVIAAKYDASVASIIDADCQFVAWNISPRGKSLWGELKAFVSLARIVRAQKPDIIHLVTIKPVLYGGIIARALRVPCCVYAISGLGAILRNTTWRSTMLRSLISPFYKLAIGHPNGAVIFQNPDDRDRFASQFDNGRLNTRMIRGSGVDTSEFTVVDEPKGVPVVTLAARLIKEKGIGEFVQAATQLKHDGYNARFVIAGGNVAEGNPGAFSDSELSELYANDAVEFIGHCDDIPTLFSESSIVVLPSYYPEGLPKVLLEASAAYRPIVTTNMPGCRDAVTKDVTGLIVEPKDVDALAQAIKQLLDNKRLRWDMGRAGRELIENEMSIEIVVEQHLAIYAELLTKKLPLKSSD